jgi:hypothetical protein
MKFTVLSSAFLLAVAVSGAVAPSDGEEFELELGLALEDEEQLFGVDPSTLSASRHAHHPALRRLAQMNATCIAHKACNRTSGKWYVRS